MVSDELIQWLRKHGGSVGHVALQYFDHGGDSVRGLVATQDLVQGALLFKIPSNLFILPPKNMEREEHAEILLAAAVAEEFRGGAGSKWRKYLRALPSREELGLYHPMYASNEDLALFSARAVRSTRSRLRDVWSKHKQGQPIEGGLAWEGRFEWQDFLHAFVIQASHRIKVLIPSESSSRPTLALVPMADMANLVGDRSANVRWEFSGDDDAVVVRTTKAVRAGTELVQAADRTEQRAKDNGHLAFQYGITLGDNPHAIPPLPADICEGLMAAIDELHSKNDKEHKAADAALVPRLRELRLQRRERPTAWAGPRRGEGRGGGAAAAAGGGEGAGHVDGGHGSAVTVRGAGRDQLLTG
eukprot:CAMPEP_0172153494 /NCGR_PEP_ID=MMETSP1050-20130122/1478_1 /TAXON_ID=233186 /ORGANISM="Cryptomonas curvata, Strain CCAP979/52" /LENGTH=357 /DNA_ID=CAMNT_0012822041 /DNA_START=136 /DNA_END=1203 /DNA_ORIENTATION=+